MPEIGIFVIGALVTLVTLIASVLIGRADLEDPRER